MNFIEYIPILFAGAMLAGFLGSLSGLGGGIVIVPLLVVFLDVDIFYAIGTSLIAVIATSTGASAAYVKEGFSNVRIAILLETATTIGAVTGVMIASHLPTSIIALIFGIALLYSAFSSLTTKEDGEMTTPKNRLATWLKLNGSYPTPTGEQPYNVCMVPLGYLLMFIAGALSGILGIGSGALKVLALDKVMKVPFKVSTTTSNFMIGVTAAASAGLYLKRGNIDPSLTMSVVLGVVLGSIIGARLLLHMRTRTLRYVFSVLIAAIAIEMIYKGLTGGV